MKRFVAPALGLVALAAASIAFSGPARAQANANVTPVQQTTPIPPVPPSPMPTGSGTPPRIRRFRGWSVADAASVATGDSTSNGEGDG